MTWSGPPRKKHPLLNLYLIKLGQERGQVYHIFLKQQKFHPTSGETFTQQLVGKRSPDNIHGDRIGYKIGRINGWGLHQRSLEWVTERALTCWAGHCIHIDHGRSDNEVRQIRKYLIVEVHFCSNFCAPPFPHCHGRKLCMDCLSYWSCNTGTTLNRHQSLDYLRLSWGRGTLLLPSNRSGAILTHTTVKNEITLRFYLRCRCQA